MCYTTCRTKMGEICGVMLWCVPLSKGQKWVISILQCNCDMMCCRTMVEESLLVLCNFDMMCCAVCRTKMGKYPYCWVILTKRHILSGWKNTPTSNPSLWGRESEFFDAAIPRLHTLPCTMTNGLEMSFSKLSINPGLLHWCLQCQEY